jgi:hypothetical protein
MEQREGIRERAVNTDGKGPLATGENGREREGIDTDRSAPLAASGRERRGEERGRGRSQTGGVHLSGDAGARGLAGPTGPTGLKRLFLFPGNF